MMIRRENPRRGAKTVEFALVSPILLFFLFATVIGAAGIFRYQAVASLAREAARYASVRGHRYELVTGNPAATPTDVYNDVIRPNSLFDQSKIGYSVTWSPDNRQGSMVTVKVTYQWLPELFLGGISLSSTATVPISY